MTSLKMKFLHLWSSKVASIGTLFFLPLLLCWVGIHCGIYKGSYNVSNIHIECTLCTSVLHLPSPIPGTVSIGIIFAFTYMCTHYLHCIHPPTPFLCYAESYIPIQWTHQPHSSFWFPSLALLTPSNSPLCSRPLVWLAPHIGRIFNSTKSLETKYDYFLDSFSFYMYLIEIMPRLLISKNDR
jgi:hypothetical protein